MAADMRKIQGQIHLQSCLDEMEHFGEDDSPFPVLTVRFWVN